LNLPVVLHLNELPPIAIFVLARLHLSASYPKAILSSPIVLENNDEYPIAILSDPVTLLHNDPYPIAVLLHPMTLSVAAPNPTAKLLHPVVTDSNAFAPRE
jgi:hypothetical protein